MRKDVRKKLIEVAERGETITYGELMREFRISRGQIGPVLREISNYEYPKRPRISAIAVRANSKTGIYSQGHPSGGFFGLDGIPAHLERPKSARKNPSLTTEEQRFVKEEQERVWYYWRTHDDEDNP